MIDSLKSIPKMQDRLLMVEKKCKKLSLKYKIKIKMVAWRYFLRILL